MSYGRDVGGASLADFEGRAANPVEVSLVGSPELAPHVTPGPLHFIEWVRYAMALPKKRARWGK